MRSLHKRNKWNSSFLLKINIIANGINITNFNGIERDYEFRRQYALDNETVL